MKFSGLENAKWYALVGVLASVLILMAILQYDSSRRVSHATTEQMLTSLAGSLANLRQGLEAELTPVCRELEQNEDQPSGNELAHYARRFERWRREAAHAGLVTAVYVWQPGKNNAGQFFALDLQRDDFAPAEWPSALDPLRRRLQAEAPAAIGFEVPPDASRVLASAQSRPQREFPGIPLVLASTHLPGNSVQAKSPDSAQPPDRGPSLRRHPGDPSPKLHRLTPRVNRFLRQASSEIPGTWMIDENVPALVHPLLVSPDSKTRQSDITWLFVILNLDMLRNHIFPELVRRYFGSGDQLPYEIAVVNDNAGDLGVIYSSDPDFGRGAVVPDVALNLFGPPMPVLGRENKAIPMPAPAATARKALGDRSAAPSQFPTYPSDQMFKIDPIRYASNDQAWEVIALHRKGSVEAAVASLFHRNLALNFSVLLVLVATIIMIVETSGRARRLAQLQMNFVANISHELRTPLTAIFLAAQNISDGVVSDQNRMARYGDAIVGQARQLSELIEQILLFSATEKNLHRYHLEPAQVDDLINASLENTSTLIREAGVTVDREIQPDLPPVMVDIKAFSHCMQNLIANAIKYGGEQHWLRIKASAEKTADPAGEIQIVVEDRGIGIEKDDLKRVFQPFYRSPAATSAQIHGSGLGLALAKSITEAMGGRLTVESAPNQGSAFTVHLPTGNRTARN